MKRITTRADLDPMKCVGCSTCIHVCPVSAMRSNPERPFERTKTPPCSDSCPAGNDIEGFIRLMQEERFGEALSHLQQTNPFPAITGRVCIHPCEETCNRQALDGAVSILHLERKIGEYESENPLLSVAQKKKKVAIIGSGPAGLTCAYYLLKQGYPVILFEAQPLLGGWLRYGIPEYRLPQQILDREIAKLQNLGLQVRAGVTVGKEVAFADLEAFDAIFIASGRHRDKRLKIAGAESPDILSGGEFLKHFRAGGKSSLGKKLAIIGGEIRPWTPPGWRCALVPSRC